MEDDKSITSLSNEELVRNAEYLLLPERERVRRAIVATVCDGRMGEQYVRGGIAIIAGLQYKDHTAEAVHVFNVLRSIFVRVRRFKAGRMFVEWLIRVLVAVNFPRRSAFPGMN